MNNYQIIIDGQPVGVIANGEKKDFTTSVGQHIITVKMDKFSSQDLIIDINDNEIKSLKVSGLKYGHWIIPVGIVALHTILLFTLDFGYIIYLLLLLLLYHLYIITICRKKYLTLREID